jgi:imidazolonepropionase-like amidohydrolase
MKRLELLVLAALVAVLLVACRRPGAPLVRAAPPALETVAFVGVTVIPMDGERRLSDQTVVVNEGRIVAIGARGEIAVPDGARRVEGRSKFLLPGLIDMHAHLDSAAALVLNVAAGVTRVRNMWGTPLTLRWRAAVERGERLGPTILTAGPIVDGEPPVWSGATVVETAAQARATVAAQKAAGYDFIKVYNNLSLVAYDALLQAAAAAGMPVDGHVPTHVPLAHALGGGQRSVEHLTGWLVALQRADSPFYGTTALPHRRHLAEFVDERKLPSLVAEAARARVWQCPTLTVDQWFAPPAERARQAARPEMKWVPPWMADWWSLREWAPPAEYAKNLRAQELLGRIVVALHAAGAPVVAGTDAPNPFVVPGFALHRELENLVAAGLTPYQALRAATAEPAELVGHGGELGIVREGARADLVLVEADPLTDVRNLSRIAGVMVGGHWLDRRALDERLRALKASYAPPADRFAGLPARSAPAGSKVEWRGRWSVGIARRVFGEERALIARRRDGSRVIVAQAVNDEPDPFRYRAVLEIGDGTGRSLTIERDDGEGRGQLTLTREGALVRVRGWTPYQPALDETRALGRDAVLVGPTLAGELLLFERLRALRPGERRTLPVAVVAFEPELTLRAATWFVERLAGNPLRLRIEVHGRYHQVIDVMLDAAGRPRAMAEAERRGLVEWHAE